MNSAVPDRIQELLDERVTDFAQAAQRHFKTNDLVVVLDFRDQPAQLEAVAREDLVAAEDLSLDLKLKLARPASELKQEHGSPDQSFWFIVIFDDDDAECGAINAAMLN